MYVAQVWKCPSIIICMIVCAYGMIPFFVWVVFVFIFLQILMSVRLELLNAVHMPPAPIQMETTIVLVKLDIVGTDSYAVSRKQYVLVNEEQ